MSLAEYGSHRDRRQVYSFAQQFLLTTHKLHFTVDRLNTIREGFNLEIRADFFNAFDRVVFSNPSTDINSPASFDSAGGQANQSSIIQFGFKVNF